MAAAKRVALILTAAVTALRPAAAQPPSFEVASVKPGVDSRSTRFSVLPGQLSVSGPGFSATPDGGLSTDELEIHDVHRQDDVDAGQRDQRN